MLLKDFESVISRVDRNVNAIYRDIEGEKHQSRGRIESHILATVANYL